MKLLFLKKLSELILDWSHDSSLLTKLGTKHLLVKMIYFYNPPPSANEVAGVFIPPANEVAGVYSDPYVRPSVRSSVRPSVYLSVLPSVPPNL